MQYSYHIITKSEITLFKNLLLIHDVISVKIEDCGIGECITVITRPYNEPERKYLIMFAHD